MNDCDDGADERVEFSVASDASARRIEDAASRQAMARAGMLAFRNQLRHRLQGSRNKNHIHHRNHPEEAKELAALLKDFRESPRREEDSGDDLWSTYNVVQENLVKGGIDCRSANTGRLVRTRRIRSVSADIRLNRALCALAERFADLKQAA